MAGQRAIFIHGTSGVGKSTLARRVVAAFPEAQLLCSDVVRAAVQAYDADQRMPIHTRSYLVPTIAGALPSSAVDVVAGYERQCAALAPALLSATRRLLADGDDLVAEGVHFSGAQTAADLRAAGIEVLEITLTLLDEDEHLKRIADRAARSQRGSALDNFTNIRAVQQHLTQLADIADEATLDVHALNGNLVPRVLEIIRRGL